jgi:phosphoribosylformylglycinamidine synthase subunit PurS
MNTYHASIRIALRKNILDVQGKTVEHALHGMGMHAINNVHIGKSVEMSVQAYSREEAHTMVESACKKLIANPVMEDFNIELTQEHSA